MTDDSRPGLPRAPEPQDETVDRIFAQMASARAERLSRPITEDEIDRVMSALDRAERLQAITAQGHDRMVVTFGRRLTSDERLALTRASVKGTTPPASDMETFPPELAHRIRRAVARHARRKADGDVGPDS